MGVIPLTITTTLSSNEYGLVRILRALANENRFIVFKNLQNDRHFATKLNAALNISRPALAKHVRILRDVKLVEQTHDVETGTVKTVYELTDFGKKIGEKIRGLTTDIEDISRQIKRDLNAELIDVNAHIRSTDLIVKGLEQRRKNKAITFREYEVLKSEYEHKRDDMQRRRQDLQKRLGVRDQ
jgi:DNA-binding HxlR family transcriptional regulator